MMTKNKIALILILLLSLNSFSQTEDFKFKRKLENTSGMWHKILLPEESLFNFNSRFSDIKIAGKDQNGNLIEVPYLLKTSENSISQTEVPFKIINVSSINSDYFYTLELAGNKEINQIKLDFEQQNFDWKIDLEGSNNQSQWFSILQDYRILSIKNNETDYSFTQADFPNSNYTFYRLKIKAKEKPKLIKAMVLELTKKDSNLKNITVKEIKKSYDKKRKQSVILVELNNKIPVSNLEIEVENNFDYYRPIKIESVLDTLQNTRELYSDFTEGTLSSLEKNVFALGNKLTKKIKITIDDHDNQPLKIKDIKLQGSPYYLIARFAEKGNYDLFYGNPKAEKPVYDIENFQENIPKNPIEITLGKEENNPEFKIEKKTPLFENKLWLWILMGIIIVVLGFYSLKMLKE